MNKLLLFLLLSCSVSLLNAQETKTAEAPKPANPDGKKPVKEPWASTMLIDNQTTLQAPKGSFSYAIYHRFSGTLNGIEDLLGIYGASNIGLSVNYAVCNRATLGFRTEKDKQYQEFSTKVSLLTQNRDGSIPVSVSYVGNIAINGLLTAKFGSNFKHADRFSYFNQLLISRKITNALSLQVGASLSHVNKVASVQVITEDSTSITTDYKGIYQNQAFGISAIGRYKFYNDYSVIAQFDQGMYLNTIETQHLKPRPNLAFGFEKATSTHAFQLFLSSARGIIPQHNYVMNQFDFNYISDMMFGFNVTINL